MNKEQFSKAAEAELNLNNALVNAGSLTMPTSSYCKSATISLRRTIACERNFPLRFCGKNAVKPS